MTTIDHLDATVLPFDEVQYVEDVLSFFKITPAFFEEPSRIPESPAWDPNFESDPAWIAACEESDRARAEGAAEIRKLYLKLVKLKGGPGGMRRKYWLLCLKHGVSGLHPSSGHYWGPDFPVDELAWKPKSQAMSYALSLAMDLRGRNRDITQDALKDLIEADLRSRPEIMQWASENYSDKKRSVKIERTAQKAAQDAFGTDFSFEIFAEQSALNSKLGKAGGRIRGAQVRTEKNARFNLWHEWRATERGQLAAMLGASAEAKVWRKDYPNHSLSARTIESYRKELLVGGAK